MITALAISGYRSLRDVIVPMAPLTLVTGANGAGKSSMYRALRMLHAAAGGSLAAEIAREGGLPRIEWAGGAFRPHRPGSLTTRRRVPANGVRLGFATDEYSYALDMGADPGMQWAQGRPSLFGQDPTFKHEAMWWGAEIRPSMLVVERRGARLQAREPGGRWQNLSQTVPPHETMLAQSLDPLAAPDLIRLRDNVRQWRFYDGFPTDALAPVRRASPGTRTLRLSPDGHDLAAAWQTIRESGFDDRLDRAVDDAFPGAAVDVVSRDGLFHLRMTQPGLRRPLTVVDLSDGTLRYLLLTAALATAAPPSLLVLNEPEASLNPALLPALGERLLEASRHTQVWVVTHAPALIDALATQPGVVSVRLHKEDAETLIEGQTILNRPRWTWVYE